MKRKDVASGDRQPTFEPQVRQRQVREHRLLRDEEGRLWRIREVTFADTAPSLVFETEGVFRRVRHYPRDWFELSDSLLYALSWRT